MARRSPTRSLARLRRFGALVAAGLLAMWLGLLIVGYAGSDWTARSYEPAPARVAAIVRTVEATPAARRPDLVRALNTPIFRVALLPPGRERVAAPGLAHSDEALMRRYAPALAGHSFTAARGPAPERAGDPVHFGWQGRRQVALQIGLAEGGFLLIAATSPIIVTGFGIPVGLIAGAAGTLISLVALWTLWREIAPLSQLARATERIDLSGPPVALPETRGQSREIRALVRAISGLQTRLSGLMQARMALLGGISHDLRTFTTRLRLRVEAIPDPEQRNRAVADIEDMIRLIDDALLAARGNDEAEAGEENRELVDFAQLVRAEVAGMAEEGMAATLAPRSPESGIYVIGDPLSLRRIVVNLATNALRYGKAARIGLSAGAGTVTLRISDDGPGIPPEARAALLEPFARGELSRSRDTGGAGLGLAVARRLAERHGGSLSLDPAANGGATVAVELPRFTDL
ncbi:sensor histidine kinase [Acidimangrovimonas sediminis]|uniref:sensor histidine kinase n=1 Tax=Acidimangrovimonas sediminis TaxID=2056283 RepID=UPI000C80B8F6|nr:HAMP domain-containing sensor histidine kinase [Acidimangrovimonas sediminis]